MGDDEAESMLDKILGFNASRDCYRLGIGGYDTVSENPITFYDRHLDVHLSLDHVEIIPSMAQLLSDVCDEKLGELMEAGPMLYELGDIPRCSSRPEISGSRDVAYAYPLNLGNTCSKFPSRLYFDPGRSDLFTVFDFNILPSSKHRPTFLTESGLCIRLRYSRPDFLSMFRPANMKPKASGVDNFKMPDMAEIYAHSPLLATWEFYPMTLAGEKLIRGMHNIPRFEWETSRTKAPQGAATSSPPSQFPTDDQSKFLRQLLSRSTKKGTSASRRKDLVSGKASKPKILRTGEKHRTVTPSVSRRTDRPYRVDSAHFLQHAWARAVVNDATFIIFNSGRYERIGFRHRASRTLFISGLVDSVACQNPAYGKLHMGLHFAIVQDAVHRQQLRFQSASPPEPGDINSAGSNKRHLPESSQASQSANSSKRRRVEAEKGRVEAENNSSTIYEALSARNLALVNLNYEAYQSPIPSSFIRRGPSCAPGFYQDSQSFKKPDRRARYSSHQYFSLTLSKSIDTGATGTVHRALAEIKMESGQILEHRLVIKLVFLDRDIRPDEEVERKVKTEEDRLLHEYRIYQHLAAGGVVDGIVPVYGLFEDIDSGTLALIMDDGGTSLRRRQLEATPGSAAAITKISQTERDTLVRAMKAIHNVGIRHCDIRTENIVVNSKDGAFIIDFDKAKFRSPAEELDRELLLVQHIVDGVAVPREGYYSF